MNDKELLELAAKAAGYDLKFSQEWHDKDEPQIKVTRGKWVGRVSWNPLTSDVDAFQLMVKLHMSVRHLSWLSNDAWKIQVGVCMDFLTEQKCVDDPLQAARRAITEMAAEIGKGM